MSATEGVSLNEGESNCSDPSASCVKLRVNGITREKVLLDEGDEITITCSGPFQHRIQLLKIGQKTTFEEQAMAGNLPANVSLKYEPLKCNGSQASGNCSKVVVMTATPEMDKKAYQCRTIIPGATDVYSRGVYINGNYNPHFRDFSNKTCILYAVIKIPTTSPQQGMCVAANDKEHVFSIFHNFTDPSPSGTHVPPSATNGQPTSTESPPIGNDSTFVILFIFTTVITP